MYNFILQAFEANSMNFSYEKFSIKPFYFYSRSTFSFGLQCYMLNFKDQIFDFIILAR